MKNRALLQWGMPAAAWLVFAACALWLTRGPLALDTDSAMRLAQVRDLLHGQGWFDTMQHRMNTPYGLAMHWSRLVDGPLAAMMLVSERFALTAWPLLLFLALLIVLARIAAVLGGRAAIAPVLGLALLATELFGDFAPGDIDHHGLQLVLMLVALDGVLERRPWLAALGIALGLGVGLESLPYALAAIAFAAAWLLDDAGKARRFGLMLAGLALLLLAATTAAPYRTMPVCDTYSLFYAALLAVGGVGLGGIAFLPRHRIAACGALALGLMALAALLNPVCFAGPYGGLDARMQTIFLARINEARPVWEFAPLAPSQFVGGYLYALFALAMSAFAAPGRARTVAAVFAAVALGVATFQIRAVPFAIVFALPGLAAALVRLLHRRGPVWLAAATLFASSAVFTLTGAALEGTAHQARRIAAFRAQEDCAGPQAIALLNVLPPGRVAAFVDQGPAIMAYTNDAAIAGPYHRDAAGILDSYAIFTGPDAQAILKRRGISYVMTCRAAPDWNFYKAKNGLVAQLAAGRIPSWLTPLGAAGEVAVFRVK